jgi:hypothetical protein
MGQKAMEKRGEVMATLIEKINALRLESGDDNQEVLSRLRRILVHSLIQKGEDSGTTEPRTDVLS